MHHEIRAAQLRQHDEQNRQIYLAWRIEQIRLATKVTQTKTSTTSKIVPLDKVLLPDPTEARQTADQMKGTLAVLSAQYGIPLRRRRG